MYQGLLRIFWFWFTFEIHNQCHPFDPVRDFWTTLPRCRHFQILLYNFVYNVKAHIKQSGKHTSWTLANMIWNIFNIFFFDHLCGLDGFSRLDMSSPSNIHLSLLNPIKIILKLIKIRSGSCLMGSVWFLIRLIKQFWVTKVSSFLWSLFQIFLCFNNEANPPSGKHSLHHNNNVLDDNLAINVSCINIVNLKKNLELRLLEVPLIQF